jgi:hypothetical protein
MPHAGRALFHSPHPPTWSPANIAKSFSRHISTVLRRLGAELESCQVEPSTRCESGMSLGQCGDSGEADEWSEVWEDLECECKEERRMGSGKHEQ